MSNPSQRIAGLSPAEKRVLLAQLLRKKAGRAKAVYPLSYNQQGIWFLYQLAPESTIYNVTFSARICSDLSIPALRGAFQALVDRHPSLRTTFFVDAGNPVQQVHEQRNIHFEETDAAAWSADELKARLVEDAYRPFDLEQGPLLRVSLFKRSEREHVLLLAVHHIVIDFWSLALILNELNVLYPAHKAGVTAVLPPLDLEYTDYLRWQNEMLSGPQGEKLWSYWRKQLAGPLPVLNLPTDRRRPPIQTYRGASYDFILNEEISSLLKTLANANGVTLYMVLLAAFQVALYCLTGQEDLLVASPVVGRNRAEFEGIVGLFTNPVMLRADLSGNPTFQAFLAQVRQTVLDALEHQDYPTLLLVQRLRPPRDLSRPPLSQVMFVLDKPHRLMEQGAPAFGLGETGLRMNPGGLVLESFALERRAATLDLVMLVIETASALSISIRYNSDLFDLAAVARIAGYFETLLRRVVMQPDTRLDALNETLARLDSQQQDPTRRHYRLIKARPRPRNREIAGSELEILSTAQRQQLLVEFNDTKTDYPQDKLIHQLFEQQVERTPDNIAVVFNDQQLTYAQLNARANQLAHHLQSLGVGPDVPVAICVERCPEMVVGLLGILKAGGAYVPLDPAYPKERLAFMLEDTRAPVLLTQARIAASMPAHRAHVLCLDSGWGAIGRESEGNPVSRSTAGNLAYVIYTSGSTGQPKGVMIEHRSLVNYLCWVGEGSLGDALAHVPLTTNLTFDMCLKQLFPSLLRGGQVWMLPDDVTAEPAALLSALGARTEVGLNCVPSLWKAMLHAIDRGQAASPNEGLAYLLFGGEQLSQDLIDKSLAALPNLQIWNIYGPTEATANACAAKIGSGDEVTIGHPIANTQIYILDPSLGPVSIGVQGELYIGGEGVARGYLNRPDLTAEKFIPHPFSTEPGARLYKTGDLARYLPDGRIEFLGRTDYQVKIRGFRIELGELEAALREHSAVREAVVLTQEDAPGEKRLVAYVVAERESRPAASDLRRFLRGRLPEFMVPSALVLLDALPLMPNGKVDRRALPALERARPELENAIVIPRTPTEEVLAEIWVQVLGIERVGVHDNFFDLGGHSLLATQVVSRIRDTFEMEMPLRRLFELPTVAGLAESIEVARRAGQNLQAPPIVRVARDEGLPLSFAQQRLWFIDQLAPGNSAYNIPAAVRFKGPLNVVALEQSLNEIVKRHETLRTIFAMVDGGPVQVIAPTLTMTLPVVDLQDMSENEREVEVRRLAAEDARRPFDLARGPLLRITLLRLGEEEHVGFLTMHHIVSDGWSTGILIREMAVLYEAFSAGRFSPLPELPIQYADFADWQRHWLQGEVLETQLSYWKEQLLDAPSLLELPTDRTRPALQGFEGAHRSLLLPRTVVDALKALSRHEGVTLFMTLLAAFKILLHRYTSQNDLIVGTPIANRNHTEIEPLIGFFVNTLVLRTDLSGNPSFRQLLRRVREVCLAGYSHQDLPFEKLVDELHLERDLSRNPLFQVMFVLNNALPETVELTGLTVSAVKGDSETAHVDLTLQISETDEGLMEAALVYNTDLFDAATITRMLKHFQILLEAAVADPDQHLSDLPLMGDAEQHQLLVEWNDTKTGHPQNLCVHQLFEAQVARTPDAIAVVLEDKQLTYGELNSRANQLAHHLRTLGVGPDVPVGICLEQSLEMIVGLLGILKAGGVYVPLDPAYPKERLAFMFEDTRMPVLLTQERLVAALPRHRAKVVCLDSGWQTVTKEESANPVTETVHDNLAYVIYTSGSTGQPKGVLVTHGSIVSHCLDIQSYYGLDSTDRILQCSSLSVDLSLEQILPTLIAGARLILARAELWDAAELQRKIAEFGLTVLNIPTPYWQELAAEWTEVPDSVSNQPRLVVVGGDVMSPEALDRWQKAAVRAVRLINAYGPTEATITATAFEIAPRLAGQTTFQKVPIGRPLANREVYILDRYGKPVPVGVPGELYIGGAGLARGYLNRPDLTAEKFVPNPFSGEPGARLYKSGDVARYRLDGNIDYLGRVDHQVKIRGFRIELEEIEAALGQHPAVREAVVLAREEASGDRRLVAYVVAQRESGPTTDDLRGFLKEKLPEYMTPAVFVPLDAMPLTPNGKVDRRGLPSPAGIRPELEKAFVAPRDDLEVQLAHLWEEVLNVRPIGLRDNFFELGGHSLAAVRLFALIENRLGKRLPLAAVFQGATVEHLAIIFRQQAKSATHTSLVAIQPGGSKRPLFLIHPAGGHVFPYVHLARCLGLDQPCYGLQARGLEKEQDPHTRIEEMATYYIDALQTVQPAGPYLLGGWSMGGVVAFEMAHQLHVQGQRVAFLALLDARIPDPDENFEDENFEATLLADFVRYFGLPLDPRKSLARIPKDELLARVLEQAKAAGLVPQDVEASQARPFIELCKADFRATRNYLMHRYPGPVTLFKAAQELAEPSTDPTLGWSRWAAGGVEVHVVPGNHASMVYQPHVEVLAEVIRTCLNYAQSAAQWPADGNESSDWVMKVG